jgi:hypothetical protein
MADINVEEVLKKLTLTEKVDLLAGLCFHAHTLVALTDNDQELTFGTPRACHIMASPHFASQMAPMV